MLDLTVAQLLSMLPADDELARMHRRRLASVKGDYRSFIDQLYEDLDICIYELQKNSHLRQHDAEDRITEDINVQLRRMGYGATHDAASGGNVDITVTSAGGTMTWIAEAKKDQAFYEGYLQLTTRYRPGSGNPSHNAAGLIFYLVKDHFPAKQRLDEWKAKLEENIGPFPNQSCTKNPLAFFSTHEMTWSGLPWTLRHVVVGLHHDPQDKSGRSRKTKPAAAQGISSSTGDSVSST